VLFGGSIRLSTAVFRSGEYPTSSSYPAHLKNRAADNFPDTGGSAQDANRYWHRIKTAQVGNVRNRTAFRFRS
jgi:hypothetical protein